MLEMMNLGGFKAPLPEGNIIKFGTGERGLAALTNSGNLYTIGSSYFSGTGATTTTWTLLDTDVVDVWVSYRSILVKKNNSWMFMGENLLFPTSLGTNLVELTDVSPYMTVVEGKEIKDLYLGPMALAVVFTDGQYAMCGINSSGGLGLGNRDPVTSLTLRTDFTNVKKIQFDWSYEDTSYLLLENGQTYVSGSSNFGQAGVTTGVLSWRLQTNVGNAVDIIGASSGFFRMIFSNGEYTMYVQGRDISGGLGTDSVSTIYTTPRAIAPVISSVLGQPKLDVGLYSARLQHPDGSFYYTGSGSGLLLGNGSPYQSTTYLFTKLTLDLAPGGEFFSIRGVYEAAYYLINGVLYGTGQSSNGFLPGSNGTRWLSFERLDTSSLV